MAMPQTVALSLALSTLSENVSIEELAAFFLRSVLTVRKWFDRVPGVIRTPRGGQRPTITVPPEVLRKWMSERGHPDEVIDTFLAERRARMMQRATVPSPREIRKSTEPVKLINTSTKVRKTNKSSKRHKVTGRPAKH
jgi:hypothetical protein